MGYSAEMAIAGGSGGIGSRVRLARRARGFATAQALADVLPDSGVTRAVIENIEAGRKTDPTVSDVLNLAWALRVPLSYLLAPVVEGGAIDLPHLTSSLAALTVEEFDAWSAGIGDGAYRPITSAERSGVAELTAFRELWAMRRERDRVSVTVGLSPEDDRAQGRIRSLDNQIAELESFLAAAGWASPKRSDGTPD